MDIKKSQGVLYISALPLLIIVVLILGAGYLLVVEDLKLPNFFDNKVEVRRLEGFPTSLDVTEDLDKRREIIRTEEELNEFLNAVDPAGLLIVKDNINFDKEILVGVVTKTLDEDGHEFKVRKVYKNDGEGELLVSLTRIDPAEDCNMEPVKNIWIDLVSVSNTDLDFDFELVKKIDNECD